MTEKPRTWETIDPARFAADNDPKPYVKVIELEPVLDLLEEVWERHKPIDGKPRNGPDRNLLALLREHGRLS